MSLIMSINRSTSGIFSLLAVLLLFQNQWLQDCRYFEGRLFIKIPSPFRCHIGFNRCRWWRRLWFPSFNSAVGAGDDDWDAFTNGDVLAASYINMSMRPNRLLVNYCHHSFIIQKSHGLVALHLRLFLSVPIFKARSLANSFCIIKVTLRAAAKNALRLYLKASWSDCLSFICSKKYLASSSFSLVSVVITSTP